MSKDPPVRPRASPGPASRPTPHRVRVTAAAERHLRGGHPWVFGDSVCDFKEGDAGCGVAVVYDHENRFLAIGLYDAASPIRIRVVQHGGGAAIDDRSFWRGRFAAATSARGPLVGAGETDGFRLINGESDGFPGLVLDRFADTLVAKTYTSAWEKRMPVMAGVFRESPGCRCIVHRRSRRLSGDGGVEVVFGPPPGGAVVFRENGLRFEADVLRGQKTGFFLDQRENRARVREIAPGCDVLNIFSFSGAFSVYAAAGGARSVTDVDISQFALDSGARNFQLNRGEGGVLGCRRREVKADAFAWLKEREREDVRKKGSGYGLVIVDPPALARSRADRAKALEAYRLLARSASSLVAPGGTLFTASCSTHVTEDEFVALVRDALGGGRRKKRGARWVEKGVFGHAPDHPATFPEARYLKAVMYVRAG